MKPWIIAVVVGAVVLLVGVPTLAVTVSKGDADTTTRSAPHRAGHDDQRGHGHGHGFGHRRGGGPPPWAGGPHRGLGQLQKLTPQQRKAIADRLDTRAGQLHRLAACLRSDKALATCAPLSRPRQQG